MTINYERIKNMTLDEMAELFSDWATFVPNCISKQLMTEWLNKESED